MKAEPASHSGASASPSSCLPDSIGLNTAGPRIAPNTAPNSTSAIPCARRSGGYMSPAAVRASSAVPLAIPISTNAVNTSTALSDAEPAAATTPPTAPMAKPPASTGTLPTRSIARPANGAAIAPDASTTAGPSPSSPSMPSTWTSVIDATAACSCSMPEFAASEADRRAVFRPMGRSAMTAAQRTRRGSGSRSSDEGATAGPPPPRLPEPLARPERQRDRRCRRDRRDRPVRHGAHGRPHSGGHRPRRLPAPADRLSPDRRRVGGPAPARAGDDRGRRRARHPPHAARRPHLHGSRGALADRRDRGVLRHSAGVLPAGVHGHRAAHRPAGRGAAGPGALEPDPQFRRADRPRDRHRARAGRGRRLGVPPGRRHLRGERRAPPARAHRRHGARRRASAAPCSPS